MSRCYACCQENCGYRSCDCYCHEETLVSRLERKATTAPAAPVNTCTVHRRYAAKCKPTGNCEACWRYFVTLNPITR